MTIPQHLAIVMDGNRRWAKERSLPSLKGHQKGAQTFKKIAEYCQKRGTKILTVFAFSTENWNRSKIEVNYLMKLFLVLFSRKNIKELQDRDVKLNIIGQREKLPAKLREKIRQIEKETENNKKFILNIALSYGGRADITQAVKNIIRKRAEIKEITEDLISKNLWTNDLPNPDLIVRTGGEKRISNFLIWQGAYSELYFTDSFWPDFSELELNEIFKDYANRKRNFGR